MVARHRRGLAALLAALAVLLVASPGMATSSSGREVVVAARAIDAGLAGDLHITISLGVYELQRSDASAQGCLERADAALYYSKRNGRNQSTLWSERLPAIAR